MTSTKYNEFFRNELSKLDSENVFLLDCDGKGNLKYFSKNDLLPVEIYDESDQNYCWKSFSPIERQFIFTDSLDDEFIKFTILEIINMIKTVNDYKFSKYLLIRDYDVDCFKNFLTKDDHVKIYIRFSLYIKNNN